MSRYALVEGSQSAHCCFDWTIVDTTRPVMIGEEHYKGQFEQVCECLNEADARLIVDALNRLAPRETPALPSGGK